MRALLHVDAARFEALVRADRAAAAAASPEGALAPDHPAMQALKALAASTPPPTARSRADLAAKLARLEEKGAPEDRLVPLRIRLDPAGALQAALARGEVPLFEDALLTCLRATVAIEPVFGWLAWLVEPARRVVVETRETWPFVVGAPGDAALDALLLGSAPLEVDGAPVEPFPSPAGWHPPAALPGVAALLQQAATAPPPPLADFIAWYREIFASWYTLSPATPLPSATSFPIEYEHWLAKARRCATRAHRVVARAARARRPAGIILY